MKQRNMCNSLSISVLGVASSAILFMSPGVAHAVSAKQLVGTWRLVSTTNTDANGAKMEPFGPHPVGSFTFDAKGHLTQVLVNSEPPTDQNKDQQHVVAIFGDYSIINGGKTLHIHVIGSNVQSQDGQTSDRDVTLAKGEMKISNSSVTVKAVGSAHVEALWKKVD